MSEHDNEAAQQLVQRYRARLLDLSRRNPLLDLTQRPGMPAAVDVVGVPGDDVYGWLARERLELGFAPLTEDEDTSDPAAVGGGKTGVLPTSLPRGNLNRVLRRILDRAELIREEQGVNTLFLALGTLTYPHPASADDRREAPILLVPVFLSRASSRSGFRVGASADDTIVNPALCMYLRRQWNMELPAIPEDGTGLDVSAYLREVEAMVLERGDAGVAVHDRSVLSTFLFHKFVMFKDLEDHQALLARHPLVQSLVERTSGLGLLGLPPDIAAIELDTARPPEETWEVVDADASQQRALAAVARGNHVVIDGPPGTGKSQTIVNVVAEALAADKTVLFVSEKRAALEVVHRRLQELGLDRHCLELHSQKGSRTDY